MKGLRSGADLAVLQPFARKLTSLGIGDAEAQQSLLQCVKVGGGIGRGGDIVGQGHNRKHVTILLEGIACLYELLKDGRRQIYSFYYRGDFCGLHGFVESTDEQLVGALTDCSVGSIPYEEVDRALERHPQLATALWRSTILEAGIVRERLINISHRSALERVAHLLCEQLHLRRTIGIESPIIPLTQIDLADAVGLSVVHINRVFQELRGLGALSRNGRVLEVTDRDRLMKAANFDARYLNMPEALARWDLEMKTDISVTEL